MKTTKIEKMFVCALVFGACVLVVSCNKLISDIENAGGVKQVIIETGKEIKDISNQISEE